MMSRHLSVETPRINTRSSSIDKVPHLVGHLGSDGVASLEEDHSQTSISISNPPRSLKAALDAAGQSLGGSSAGDTMSETSEEDYDHLKHDPDAVIAGGKGGGFVREEARTPDVQSNGIKSYEEIKAPSKRPGPTRLKSIPVTLNKLKEKGRYILTADDAALREILKTGMERVSSLILMRT
jgi:sterol O-acyltransferase